MQLTGGALAPKTDLLQELGTGQWLFRNGWFGTRANLLVSAFVTVKYNKTTLSDNL